MSSHRSPSEVRASLRHPIIDGDGHWVEYNPVFAERMRTLAATRRPTASSPRSAAFPTR
jgi:hypothetical protein